jgi:hypothetical protein
MLKLHLITVIDFKYKIKIKFFFTEGLFLSTSYIYGLYPLGLLPFDLLPFGLFPLGLL